MDYSAGMHTVEELQEMMELRKQMEQLQARYEVILKRPLQTAPAAVCVPVAAPAPPPKAPEPPPATVPAPPAAAPVPPVPAVPAPAAAPASAPVPPVPAVPAPAPVPASAPVAPVSPAAAPTPPEAPAVASPAPPAPSAPAPTGGSLRESIAAVIQAAGKPLVFDEIYAGLEAGGYTLPADKPKLVVRKTLFNKAVFKMVGKDKLGQGKYEVA